MRSPGPSTARQAIGYVLAVPTACLVAGALHFRLAPLRRSHVIARFVARVAIVDIFYATFAAVMIGVAGPYAFAGRMWGGGWNASPTSGRDMLEMGSPWESAAPCCGRP